MGKYIIIILILLLLSCSELPTRNNPYDLYFDMPEPTDIELENITLTSKKLSWNYDLGRFDGFIISRQVNSSWSVIATVGMNVRSMTDYNAPVNVDLNYKIVAYADQNFSDEVISEKITNTIPAPIDLTVTQINLYSYRLGWEQDHIIGEDGFVVERQIGEESYEQVAVLDADTETYTDNWEADIRGSNEVIYQIKAYVGDEYSEAVIAESEIMQYSFAPSNLTFEKLSLSRIQLSWQDNSDGEEGFRIDKKLGSGDWNIGFDIVEPDSTIWIDEAAEINEEITYRILAYYGAIESRMIETEIIDNSFSAPTDLAYAKLFINRIELSWHDNSDYETGFRIDKKIGTGEWILGYANLAANTTSWVDENVEVNLVIKYRLQAYCGEIYTEGIETGEIDNLLPAPQELEINTDGSELSLTWEYDLAGVDGFRLERKEIGGNWELYADNLPANTHQYTDNFVNYDNSYRIKAYYDNYESANSNTVINIEWCYVNSGIYTFGEEDEILYIGYDYLMMKYEVTNQQFKGYLEEALTEGLIYLTDSEIVGCGNDYVYYQSDKITWSENEFIIQTGYEKHPVSRITWFGAWAFCEYYGLDLPTEQEWEKAARKYTGNEYPWGNEISGERANFFYSGDPWDNGTTPVGYYDGDNGTINSPSPYGCYDMCGNVFEWTNSRMTETSSDRVLRGGAFYYDTISYDDLPSWYRNGKGPLSRLNIYGFRCARRFD